MKKITAEFKKDWGYMLSSFGEAIGVISCPNNIKNGETLTFDTTLQFRKAISQHFDTTKIVFNSNIEITFEHTPLNFSLKVGGYIQYFQLITIPIY